MALNLFYITNSPEVALIAESCGVDRIWIDLETLGKAERQPGNTVKSCHSIDDIRVIKPLLTRSELLVRVQPWNRGSIDEINQVIDAGADIIMLPMWKSVSEVKSFLNAVNGRVKTSLLLETGEAAGCIDEVLKLDFDEIHIGLNDLHLSYGMDFMFQLLADGTVEMLCDKFRAKGIPYGFGGIAKLGAGLLPAERVIMEHYRLGSTRAILSRSFCNTAEIKDPGEIRRVFESGMEELRKYEKYCSEADPGQLEANRLQVCAAVDKIVESIREKRSSAA